MFFSTFLEKIIKTNVNKEYGVTTSKIQKTTSENQIKSIGSCDRFSPSSSCASIDSGYYEQSFPSSPEASCSSLTNQVVLVPEKSETVSTNKSNYDQK